MVDQSRIRVDGSASGARPGTWIETMTRISDAEILLTTLRKHRLSVRIEGGTERDKQGLDRLLREWRTSTETLVRLKDGSAATYMHERLEAFYDKWQPFHLVLDQLTSVSDVQKLMISILQRSMHGRPPAKGTIRGIIGKSC